jgi:ADP-ribosylation factor 1/2
MWRLSRSDPIVTIPTIGFNVETISFQGIVITAWDVGGRSKMRTLWRHYYQKTEGIVFVIDSNDIDRIQDAAEELERLLAEDELLGVPVLIFANKSDLPSARSPEEILKSLKLDSTPRKFQIFKSIATTGDGLKDGMKWLTTAMK